MPKQKRVFSAHCARQAKKRKRNQREDPLKRQKEQEHNTAARRQLRLDCLERRQEERLRDTAAHQQHNTDARQQIRLQDPQRRDEERLHDTAAHKRIRQYDPERREEEQQRNTIGRKLELTHILTNCGDTLAHRVARENPARRMEERQRDLLRHRETRSDPQYQISQQQINNMRRQQVRNSREASLRALNYQPDNFYNTTDVGTLSSRCSNCGALKFNKETNSLCCSKGNVQLEEFPQLQPFLRHLYEGIDSSGKHFLANIRKYNSAFRMTSFGCNEQSMAGFNPSFRIQGQVYHLIGSIIPTEGESPKFAQIYFIDDRVTELATRSAIVDGLKPDIIRGINHLLRESNHYVEVFKVAKEIFEQEDAPSNVKIVINESKRPSGKHSRRYNRPLQFQLE